jgi:hypothetical protein
VLQPLLFFAFTTFSRGFIQNLLYCGHQPLAITVETGISDSQGVPAN